MGKDSIIQQINDYRRISNITIREIAEKTGINYQFLTNVFNGKNGISVERIELILDAIGLDIELVQK